jgi:hypothetical protein
VVANHLKESAISALQAPEIYVPITTVVSFSLNRPQGSCENLCRVKEEIHNQNTEELRAMDGVTELGAARNPVHK